jgi:hypothetical protein
MSTLTCGRTGCTATAEPARVNGLFTDPPGWSNVTVTGLPIVHKRLCAACTIAVRVLLHTSPTVVELDREAAIEGAFTRGYAEGADDARARHAAERPVEA